MAKTTTATPEPSPSEATMQQSELDELHTRAKAIGLHDHHLGALLIDLVRHIGGAHGLTVTSDNPASAEEGESNAN